MSLLNDVTNKPWDEVGLPDGIEPKPVFSVSDERVALTVFLIIVSVVFSLLLVSYYIRMQLGDWVPMLLPDQLWLNTGALVLGSIFMQLAVAASSREAVVGLAKGAGLLFLLGGLFTIAFVAGQYQVWDQLAASGQGVRTNPSNSFFYLLTFVHVLHLLGGLWVWSRAEIRIAHGSTSHDIQQSIRLCAIYWHFLLAIWVGLFVLMSYT